ncbi:putative type I restriction enzymeP M protein [Planctomycetes bacterium CA13]|uniref:site-specific DNA-methyltransferase (adenine-specific) n=1 Tax=Novipirellula herctigrandis TaxID=2527986 RepID=A0A5C5Z1X0_9BACT|nr:putative type I restriction enzymeP M protein [Planctomycetes bacterium CA13]
MSSSNTSTWIDQFGLQHRDAPEFFVDESSLAGDVPQAHLLHRGFDDLDLDGILCTGNSPLVYFRCLNISDAETEAKLYRDFWHHGGAPVLVVITNDSVHVYSGLTRPDTSENRAGLVETLDRVSDDLPALLLSIESGHYFHQNRKSFNPDQRVDRALLSNLNDTRQQLNDLSQRDIPDQVLDSLLCRLVFTAYLFDRGVIGGDYLASIDVPDCEHLRDVLGIHPTGQAKAALYKLFERLAVDFNGDLFADNLTVESRYIVNKHIEVLSAFFHGTSVKTGQQSFWPYDFGRIPIETVSAIYERFLTESDKQKGAFYTPRFLAEVVLDVALEKMPNLIGKTFFDPACGSGIFLVGLFNRLAQQWREVNPRARNNTIARELMSLIQESLFGVDVNPTACRIAAFSLYLAYLDQLSPRDIQQLQEKGRALPKLVTDSDTQRNITCIDFFKESSSIPTNASLVIGNPPWGDIAGPETLAGQWCSRNDVRLPNNQIASAFIRKAARHTENGGVVCVVLPAGVLFNNSGKAIQFQRDWIESHSLQCVLNLADYQRFLFEAAGFPAIVVRYNPAEPNLKAHRINYWSPKSDWSVTKAEVIRIAEQDCITLHQSQVVEDLASLDAPQVWKRHFWATPRDRRLLDRLSDLPRLRDNVRQVREKSDKRWIIGEGFQPLGPGDDPAESKQVELDSTVFVEATNDQFNLFMTVADCDNLGSKSVTVRQRSGVSTQVFNAPHTLFTAGFSKVVFLDFSASFRHSVKGIQGPKQDADLLKFLTVYLKSKLARYFLFHGSASWGVSRARIYDEELLKLPFPFPETHFGPQSANSIIESVCDVFAQFQAKLLSFPGSKKQLVKEAMVRFDELVFDYFDIADTERDLINETISISIPSTRPTRSRLNVPTVKTSSPQQREAYLARVCDLLNDWSARGDSGVRGQVLISADSGIGLAVLEKVDRSQITTPMPSESTSIVETLDRLRQIATKQHGAIELVRGIKVFDGNKLYIVKPLEQRNWTLTSAMNDADEIAGSLLMQSAEQPA